MTMRTVLFFALALGLLSTPLSAAPKEGGSAKVIKKLQLMVQDATAERDRVKAESAKQLADMELAKKEVEKNLEKEKKAKAELEKKELKLNGEIAAQISNAEEIRGRLDKTTAKLHEVIDKYNALNQAKNELANEHANLQNTQQFTASELKACETKNVKMFEGAKLVIAGYKRCQDKDLIDMVTDSEPATQITNIGFEKIIQDYEDKLIKQKFYPSPNPKK